MSRPYSPATDATPRDSDLDPHAGCREREAALRRALSAADWVAKEANALRLEMESLESPRPDAIYRDLVRRLLRIRLAAYQAARKEVTP